MPAAYASRTTLPPPMQGSLPAGGLRLYREGIEPSGSLRKVSDLHVFLLSRAYPDASWAHARRKFFDLARLQKAPIAIAAVERIDALFAIEREINGMMPQQRLAVRTQRGKLSRRSETAKAIDYSLKRWLALTRFLADGRLCISNNAAERALRGIAVGRHNWTFAGSDEGARRAAAVYTLIETAKLNGIDPQAWLADVLARLPDHPMRRVGELLPWQWCGSCRQAA